MNESDEDVPDGLDFLDVEVDLSEDGTTPCAAVLAIHATAGGSVRGEHLRFIASRWDRHLVPYLVQQSFHAATEPGGGPFGQGPNVVKAADFAVKRARRSELTPDVLREVAEVHGDPDHYRTCGRDACRAPVATSTVRVARHFGLSRDGANTRIRRARDAGYLPPARRRS
ncbi:hypothetical protein [Intrasporangium mesophilum]